MPDDPSALVHCFGRISMGHDFLDFDDDDLDMLDFGSTDSADLTGQAAQLCESASQQLGKKHGCLFYGIAAFFVLWLLVFCGSIVWFFVCLFFGIKIGAEVYNAPKTQEFLRGEKPPASVKTLEAGETP